VKLMQGVDSQGRYVRLGKRQENFAKRLETPFLGKLLDPDEPGNASHEGLSLLSLDPVGLFRLLVGEPADALAEPTPRQLPLLLDSREEQESARARRVAGDAPPEIDKGAV
jgi:hypothetical protein